MYWVAARATAGHAYGTLKALVYSKAVDDYNYKERSTITQRSSVNASRMVRQHSRRRKWGGQPSEWLRMRCERKYIKLYTQPSPLQVITAVQL